MNDLTLAQTRSGDPSSTEFVSQFSSFLRQRGALSLEALRRAELAARDTGERFDVVLTRLGLVTEMDMTHLAAGFLGLSAMTARDIPGAALDVPGLAPDFLRRMGWLPLRQEQGELLVAVSDPFLPDTADVLSFHLGMPVRIVVGAGADISRTLERLYGNGSESSPATGGVGDASSANEDDVRRLTDLASEAPIVRLVHDTIQRAIEADASDIHLEPGEHGLAVRQRIDGELQTMAIEPVGRAAAIISRIKIMARLDIAERRLPQDGRIHITARGRDVELRVSTMPTLRGESVVLRILDRGQIALDLPTLGLSDGLLTSLYALLDKPNGLILVTGPTGSGKSTTLYAALSRLNKPSRKTFTIEDPVETQIAGLTQVQVQPRIGLTFAHALRSILRQDPNVIMVGEIRDVETAQMAMQAALTGHLVLSTLHTNSALATTTRLADMGIEDYLIASTLKGVLAQRLVRRLCAHCAQPAEPTAALVACLDRVSSVGDRGPYDFARLRRPVGCLTCRNTGFRGRVAIAELLVVDALVAAALVGNGGEAKIAEAAGRSGTRSMLADGLEKVCAGETTLDEVLRAAQDN